MLNIERLSDGNHFFWPQQLYLEYRETGNRVKMQGRHTGRDSNPGAQNHFFITGAQLIRWGQGLKLKTSNWLIMSIFFFTSKNKLNCGIYQDLKRFPWIQSIMSSPSPLITLTNPKVSSAEEQRHIFETNVDWILRGWGWGVWGGSKAQPTAWALERWHFQKSVSFYSVFPSVIHTYLSISCMSWPFLVFAPFCFFPSNGTHPEIFIN